MSFGSVAACAGWGCTILWDLQYCSKLKPYITNRSGPGRGARTNHFEVKQCNLDLVSAIYFGCQGEAAKHFLFFSLF